MRISIGNDHGGVHIGKFLADGLNGTGINVTYYGMFSDDVSVDYPDFAKKVAHDVATMASEYGILVCRSGIGMCIAANKYKGVRAAVCQSEDIAKAARQHNDINILCIGADYITADTALLVAKTFIMTKFSGGRHAERIKKIEEIENACIS